MIKMNANRSKKGLVLVGVLWIVIVLTAIVAILGRQSRLDSKMVLAKSEAIRTKWASRAGIERAVAVLNEDEKDTDCHNDIWYSDTEDFNDFPMTRCSYNVIVSDESGKLNINTASFDQLMGLPYMTEDIADAITDWRDSDSDVNGYGTEDGYYENLTYGYINRNAPFRTIRELLLVKGVTDELFYGEDTNLNGRLDYNEMDGDANPPADNGDSYLDVGWAAYITCYPSESSTTTTTDANQAAVLTSPNTDNSSIVSAASNQSTGSLILTAAVNTSSSTTISAVGNSNQNTNNQNTNSQNTSSQNTSSQNTNSQTTSSQTTSSQTSSQTTQTTSTTQTTGQTAATGALVNINTASETVLAALMGGTDQAYAAAQGIIGYRENMEYGIEDISELTDNGIISSDMLSLIQDYVTVSSNIFRITCTATADRGGKPGTTLTTEVVIDRSTSPYKVLYWYQGASN